MKAWNATIGFPDIFDMRQDLQIFNNMKAAAPIALQRIDMVNVMRNSSLASQSRGLNINSFDSVEIGPRWSSLQFRCIPFGPTSGHFATISFSIFTSSTICLIAIILLIFTHFDKLLLAIGSIPFSVRILSISGMFLSKSAPFGSYFFRMVIAIFLLLRTDLFFMLGGIFFDFSFYIISIARIIISGANRLARTAINIESILYARVSAKIAFWFINTAVSTFFHGALNG